MSLLTPAAVAAIEDLELEARLVVEGSRSGGHRSPFHGFTAEFSQHRPYRPGDDLKYLDWKLLARSDRLYSRQFKETTSLSAMIVLDTSASMRFPTDHADLDKFRYASILASALAYLIVGQGDSVGVLTRQEGRFTYLPARGGRPHLRALLAQIARLEPAGDWQLDAAIARGAELLKRRGVILVLSDFYDATDATDRELRRVARRGHDVALLQILSRSEIAFPYTADVEFEDLESGRRMLVDANTTAREYRAAVATFLSRCRQQALRDGLDYALMPTDVAPSGALRTWLLHRAERASAGVLAVRRA